jgi:hypothetical protein
MQNLRPFDGLQPFLVNMDLPTEIKLRLLRSSDSQSACLSKNDLDLILSEPVKKPSAEGFFTYYSERFVC